KLSQEAINDSHVDEAKINELNEEVESLRNEIKALTAALVALGIADAVALTMGIAITIAAWPVGALAWLVLGPIVAIATTYIVIAAKKIVAAKDKIKADQERMGEVEADVTTLKLISSSYASMVRESETIETSLAAILAAWRALESDVVEAVTDIRSAIA